VLKILKVTITVSLLCAVVFVKNSNASESLEPFKVPRSSVVEVKDEKRGLAYSLFIKLPKSYGKNKDKEYPVIYLTDAWYAFQVVSGATRYPMNANTMKEAIIVGISYANGSKRDNSRVLDYTPTASKSWDQPTGDAPKFMDFIENVVFKYVTKNYRVDTTNRTFVGNSLGGLFGSYVLLTKPKLFKNYILGSPSYWFDNKFIFRFEEGIAKNMAKIYANVFIAIGERETKSHESRYEMVADAKMFHKKMLAWQQPNLKTKLFIIPHANHQTAFPTTAIQGLHWVLKK